MPASRLNTLEVDSRKQWREWLREHHDSVSEIWLVFHKPHSSRKSIPYEDAVEEALCFGWIDSLIQRLDDHRYARKFTPRKPDSKWSTSNRRRYAALQERGLLEAPGLARAPTGRSGDAPPRRSFTTIPPYIEEQLRAHARVWEFFEGLSPSCRRQYIGWIDAARREETRRKRLREAVTLLAAGKKLGIR